MSDGPSISDLAKLAMFSGRLSQVHVENLKNFPFIFFNGITEAKIEHDISTKKEGNSLVSYNLTITGENDHMEKRYLALLSAVRFIFWKEVQVKLTVNGQEYKNEQ